MSQTHEDDLFRGSSMTFGEHLEELRKRLFRAAAWLGVGVIIGTIMGERVVHWIETPLTNALTNFYKNQAIAKYNGNIPPGDQQLLDEGYLSEALYIEPAAVLSAIAATHSNQQLPSWSNLRLTGAALKDPKVIAAAIVAGGDDKKPSPGRHIYSLLTAKQREVVAKIAKADKPDPADVEQFAAALDRLLGRTDFYDAASFADTEERKLPPALRESLEKASTLGIDVLHGKNWQALQFAWFDTVENPRTDVAQIKVWHKAEDDSRVKLVAINTMDGFVIWVKASLLTGFILASPWIFRELWLFVAAGLYPHERRYVYTFLPFSAGLFLAGAAMAFFIAFPPVLKFLLGFNGYLGINTEPRINEWFSFVLFLPLAFGIGFQLPLVMLFIHRLGLVSVETYRKQWRIAILVILVTVVLLNPSPDITSMMLMSAPMILLYGGGILLCYYSTKRRPQALGGE